MIVDTSAIVALLLGEPQAGDIAQLLADGPARMSAATLVELHAVAANRLSPVQQRRLERLLVEAQVEIVAFTETGCGRRPGATRFRTGSGHPARLNLGDAYAYAVAATTTEPLLFVGDDFTHTDLVPAL